MYNLMLLACSLISAADQGVDTNIVPRSSSVDESPAPKDYPRAGALVSTVMLAKWIETRTEKLVIVDARGDDDYAQGHLPQARNIPSDMLQNTQNPPYLMPTVDELKALSARVGIDADSHVIVYDEDDGRLAARVWFTLHAYGHDNAAILNGGAAKWKEEGREWTEKLPAAVAKAGTFQPLANLRGVCKSDDLSQFRMRVQEIGKLPPTTMLDARSLQEYMGEVVRGKSGGHIPGAANLEWSALMSGKEHARVWRSAPEIHTILHLTGVERDQKTAIYDQAGGRSAHLYFTLWLMGFDKAFNYVAGWREYGNRDDVEIEK